MALNFVIRINKLKSFRVVVQRAVYTKEGKVEKFVVLGTLKGIDDAALKAFIQEKQLDEQEQYQLENYAATLKFNQQEFNIKLDTLKQEKLIYITSDYEEALFKLWKLAKRNKIDFCPVEIQHRALLHKAKAVERELNAKIGKPVAILEKIGIDVRPYEAKTFNKYAEQTNQALFQLISELKEPSQEKLCAEFNKIAHEKYGKNVNLRPMYIKDYASTVNRYPLWYCSVAIDLLMQHGVNPIEHISPAKIIKHWLRLRKNKMNIDKAYEVFKAEFKPPKAEESRIKNTIKQLYSQGDKI